MLLSLLPCLLPALGLALVGHTDGGTTGGQMGGRYDGLSHCDPLANVFVINVAGAVGAARRAQAIAELDKAGISQYVISNAVTPLDFKYPEVLLAGESIRLRDRRMRRRISVGEAALALSHLAIYNKILEGNISCALVFEDDFRLVEPSTFKDRISSVGLPAEYDWVKVDDCRWKGSHNGPPGPVHPPRVDQLETNPWFQIPGRGPCTSGYIVSSAGARLLRAANSPLWMNADGSMDPLHIRYTAAADRLPTKQFLFEPPLSWQSDEIDEGGIDDAASLLRKAMKVPQGRQ